MSLAPLSVTAAEQLCWTPATQLASMVRARQVAPSEIAAAVADRIESVNPALNAFITFDREQLETDARRLDQEVVDGTASGRLHGVPFSVKALTSMEGQPEDASLLPLKGRLGTKDAAVVTRLRKAGGLFLGSTNAPEVGYYGGTNNHAYGQTQNPWRTGHTPGGSSGGAGAAVAAGLGPLAEGADGAGSVRIPASLCGVVGFKPSLGRIPQTLFAGRHYTHLFHGPLTRTVGDAALMFDVMAGPDASDPISVPREGVDFTDPLQQDMTGRRIAWSPDLGLGYVDPEVAAICRSAVRAFEELGATVVEATPPWQDLEEAMWNALWVPGYACKYDMIDWRAARGSVDDALIEMMIEAESLTAREVGLAEAARGRMWDVFVEFMGQYDLLVSPTLATASFSAEQFAPDFLAGEPLRRQLLGWILTYPYNMTTTPAISVPAGFTGDGRPVGLQIAGGHLADADVLAAAAAFEQVHPWAHLTPPL